MRRHSRLAALAAFAAGFAFAVLSGCPSDNFERPGVDPRIIAMMQGDASPGMLVVAKDGKCPAGYQQFTADTCMKMGDCDAGMMMMPDGTCQMMGGGDGGCPAGMMMMPDGGCQPMTDGGPTCDGGMMMGGQCTSMNGVRRAWVIQALSGAEGIDGIDPATDNEMAMSFVMMNNFGGINGLQDVSAMSPDQRYVYLAVSKPAKLTVIDMMLAPRPDVIQEIPIGAGSDESHGIAVAPDGSAVFLANQTANKIVRISTKDWTVTKTLTATDLPDLNAPSSLSLNAAGLLMIGSASDTGTKVTFVDTANGTLTAKPALTSTLTGGARPYRCAWLHTADEGFCVATGARGGDGGGTGNSLWHIIPGAAAAKTTTTLTGTPFDVGSSLNDNLLFITQNDGVSMFYAGDNTARANPLSIGSTPTGAGAYHLAVTYDGKWLFVTNTAAGTVSRIPVGGSTIAHTYSGLGQPMGVYVVP